MECSSSESACARVRASCGPTATPRSRNSYRNSTNMKTPGRTARLRPRPAAAVHRLGEREQVLLALEQRAEERHRIVELHARDARATQHGDPVDQLARRGALAQPLHVAQLVEDA